MTPHEGGEVTLEELAERCEQASGPDRELDADIARAFGWIFNKGLAFSRDGVARPRPKPTSSVDAAITLVPDGYVWMLANTGIDDSTADLTRATAMVGLPDDMEGEPVSAASPALALCAASLRARAKESE